MIRRLAAVMALALFLGASGCTTENNLGDCKGLLNKDEEQVALRYELKGMNIFWAFVFSETLVVPFLVGGLWLYCPTGKK